MQTDLKTTKEKEHYIKVIYKLLEANKKVSVSTISKSLGVSKSSVSNMLKKLVKMSLLRLLLINLFYFQKKEKKMLKKLLQNID
jgi:Mn-dependent DtxR family transcriptional regulator